MIFGDGAAAHGDRAGRRRASSRHRGAADLRGRTVTEVNSIIWPNPEFDNNITVYGPEVRALAGSDTSSR